MKSLNQLFTAALVAFSFNVFAGDCTALSGNYTISKNEGADFSSVTEAVHAAECGGITGPVTFNIEAGNYNERVVMSIIPGASPFNTITFQSKSGNNTDVVISYATSDATLVINGTGYVSFENISITHRAATYGNTARIDGKANNIHFSNVIFDGVDAARTGANSATVYFTSSAPKSNISFENCDINNGSVGIFKMGMDAAVADTKTTINGNLFFNQFESAIVMANEDAPAINNNIISSLSNFSNYVGISLSNVSNQVTLNNNVITMATGSTGIQMQNCLAKVTHLGQVTGNSVVVGGKDEASGIMLTGTTDNQVLNFNRVKLSKDASTANQAYYRNSGSGNNVNMLNNIFYDLSTGQYTIVGNTYKDMFNQMPVQSNATLTASANGIMVEKAMPVK